MDSKHVGDESGLSRSQFLTRTAAVAVGVGALGIVGCGDDDGGSGSSDSGAPSGLLRVGLVGGSAADKSLDPDVQGPAISTQYSRTYAMYEPLFRIYNGETVMALAESAEPNADASKWEVKLREGVEFSNGKPVTPEDVIFSMKRHAKKDSVHAQIVSFIDRVEKTGPSSVSFVLTGPRATFVQDLGSGLPASSIVPVDFNAAAPVGAGAFAFVSHQPGRKLTLKANPNYWDGAPKIETLEFIEFADPSARVNALLAGQIDATDSLVGAQYQQVKARSGMKTVVNPGDGFTTLAMNTQAAPFDDVRVRQAFRLLIDRDAMVQQAYGGLGSIGNDVFGRFDPLRADLPQREQDLEQARSLLQEAGKTNLNIELATADITAVAGPMSEVFAEQAKQAGITVKIKKIPASDYFSPATGYGSHAFSVSFGGTSNYMRTVDLTTGPEPPYNEIHFENERYFGLIEEVRKTPDEGKRKELIGEMQQIDYDEGGYIIAAFDSGVSGFSDKVSGFEEVKGSFGLNDYRFEKVSVKS